MSGSGGGFDPVKLRSQIRELERKLEDAAYESAVAELLSGVLANANDRDVALIQGHLNSIKEAIGAEVDAFVDLLFGGSVAKRTYVAGLSDVDALVVFRDEALGLRPPIEVRDHLIRLLRDRLPSIPIEPDGFAVSIRYSDGLVQLVPARLRGEDYLLPNETSLAWTRVRPRAFADSLTAANRALGGKLIPTIKLAKVALTGLPEPRRPSGYHLEALAVEVFRAYDGVKTTKAMLPHFFSRAAERVLAAIPDATQQSRTVDSHLGEAGSVERQILSDSMGRIARRLENADGARSVEQWKRVLGEE